MLAVPLVVFLRIDNGAYGAFPSGACALVLDSLDTFPSGACALGAFPLDAFPSGAYALASDLDFLDHIYICFLAVDMVVSSYIDKG